MRLLLDTHCWLWTLLAPERLGPAAREAFCNPANEVFLSAASSWEIAIKCRLGKLALPEAAERYVPKRMAAQGLSALPIHHVHALKVAQLPDHHRDPFDRILVAQATVEGWPVLTADPLLCRYQVEVIWAARSEPPPEARLVRF